MAIKSAGVFLTVILGIGWAIIAKSSSNAPFSQRPDGLAVAAADQLTLLLHAPSHFIFACIRSLMNASDLYIHSTITLVGWNYVNTPLVVSIIICVGILVAALYAKNELISIRKTLSILAAMSLAGIISIFFTLYAVFSPVGGKFVDGIQGRYFIPFLIPIILAIISYLPFDIKIKKNIIPYVFGIFAVIGLLTSVTFYYLVTY
jgi:uncharacterized membrane protein